MTEAEWLASGDVNAMLAWLGDATETIRTRWHGPVEVPRWRTSERKLWLFVAEAHRPFTSLMATSAGSAMLDAIIAWADGELTATARDELVKAAEEQERASQPGPFVESVLSFVVGLARQTHRPFDRAIRSPVVGAEWANLLREIVGNPFRPVVVEPLWLAANDGAVRHLAEGIAATRDHSSMPVLADALEDAGCRDEAILSHLRSPGPHVRGCWALGLILGKA